MGCTTGSGTTVTEDDVQALVQRLMTSEQSTREDYLQALGYLDEAVCEAQAVGQAQAGRIAAPCVGYGTYLFARMCSHGIAAIRAAPLSRWVKSDHQDWGFNVLACHARALLEGNLYFLLKWHQELDLFPMCPHLLKKKYEYCFPQFRLCLYKAYPNM